jgi:multidrug resistance efflux pump
MAKFSLLTFLILGIAACAGPLQRSGCASQIQEAQTNLDAAEAKLEQANTAATASPNPQAFGKVASAAADVAGAQAALDSTRGDCSVAP